MAQATGAFAPGYAKKTLIAKCTQTGTDAPVFASGNPIVNTYGGDFVLTRTGEGVFVFTRTGELTQAKTYVKAVSQDGSKAFSYANTSANAVTLTWTDLATPSAADCEAFDIIIETYA